MKIEQEVPDVFQPVVITLESMAEVLCLFTAINARIDVLGGNEELADEYDFLVTIGNFFEDIS
jgi:NTP pyrophosphatase (non-canonical NTP hydrolase)